MSNRILDFVVVHHRLDPVETELRVHAKLEHLTPATQIRGRLLGPRCRYASTIEIAYPLREVERAGHIELRVIIPEPSWWDPESPFLYEGVLELWQDGVLCERADLVHGIRTLQITPLGLRLNGSQFTLRGRIIETGLTPELAAKMRSEGVNTLVAAGAESNLEIWRSADRLGFFVVGMSDEPMRFVQWRHELAGHASNFGWIFNRADFFAGPHQEADRAMFYGVNTSATGTPPNADFLVCNERELSWLAGAELPKVVLVDRFPDPASASAEVLGWIESPTA